MIAWLVEVNKDHGDWSPDKAIRNYLIQSSPALAGPVGTVVSDAKPYSRHIIPKESQTPLVYEIGCFSVRTSVFSCMKMLPYRAACGEALCWGVKKDNAET